MNGRKTKEGEQNHNKAIPGPHIRVTRSGRDVIRGCVRLYRKGCHVLEYYRNENKISTVPDYLSISKNRKGDRETLCEVHVTYIHGLVYNTVCMARYINSWTSIQEVTANRCDIEVFTERNTFYKLINISMF